MSVQTHEGMCAPVVQFKVQMNMKKNGRVKHKGRASICICFMSKCCTSWDVGCICSGNKDQEKVQGKSVMKEDRGLEEVEEENIENLTVRR